MKLPDELTRLLGEVPALSRAYLMGGCVRDSLLGITHKDFDLDAGKAAPNGPDAKGSEAGEA
ncbi:hypothetical protein SBV1_390031 [Verrucomicrobia bacterium]|nr:hypothetical protein SBV1_390031 [Verrucomicrobiota bacterium]